MEQSTHLPSPCVLVIAVLSFVSDLSNPVLIFGVKEEPVLSHGECVFGLWAQFEKVFKRSVLEFPVSAVGVAEVN